VRFEFYFIGKTSEPYLIEGIESYHRKLGYYMNSGIKIIPVSSEKNKSKALKEECSKILKSITAQDFVVVLDEKGKQYSSVEFSKEIQKVLNRSYQRMVFIIGSAYGIDIELSARADTIHSFSRFTFTHQMIRLMLMEQVYRAMTILKGESYHHD